MLLAAEHELPVSCTHSAAGATTRSTRCGFAGCAAGHICRLSEVGTERAFAALQLKVEGGSAVLPAAQLAQKPEHLFEVRPAELP